MKILHLFSDWKWTGPSEPMLNLCKALEGKGHDVTLAYRKPPLPVENSLERRVLEEADLRTPRRPGQVRSPTAQGAMIQLKKPPVSQ
jgi:hypothetical protein